MTLPIWRDKIAAIIASAEANQHASEARLNAKQVAMAADLARLLFMVRDAGRTMAYIEKDALANLSHAQASAEAGYASE